MQEVATSPKRRGRPPKYRDASQKIEGARLRKQRQRERERTEGLQSVEFRLTSDVLSALAATAALTFTDPKALGAQLVADALPAYRQKVEQLSERAGRLWLQIAPSYRAAQSLTQAQVGAVSAKLDGVRRQLTGMGWSREHVERFIRRSGERAFVRRRQAPANEPQRPIRAPRRPAA